MQRSSALSSVEAAAGTKLPASRERYSAAISTVGASVLYRAMMRRGRARQTSAKTAATPSAMPRFTRKLRRSAGLFPCPRYWASITAATVPTDAVSTPWMEENFPASPTPATLTLPSRPIMI